MFDSKTIDVAIGIVFMYLFISLICTAVTEGLSRIFGLRSEYLKKGLQQLLSDPDFAGNVMSHSLVVGLQEPNSRIWFLAWLHSAWGWINKLIGKRTTPPVPGDTKSGNTQDMPSYLSPQSFRAATVENLLSNAQLKRLRERLADLPVDVQGVVKPLVDAASQAETALGLLTDLTNQLPDGTVKTRLTLAIPPVGASLEEARSAINKVGEYTASMAEGKLKHDLEAILKVGRDDLTKVPEILRSMQNYAAGLDATTQAEQMAAVNGLVGEVKSLATMGDTAVATITSAIDDLPEGGLKQSLRALLLDVGTDVQKLNKKIEEWFDDQMSRVTGWYKRHVRWFVIGTAIVVATAANADTVRVGLTLWQDQEIREVVSGLANKTANSQTPGFNCPPAAADATPTPQALTGLPSTPECQKTLIEDLRKGLSEVNLIGWRANDTSVSDPREVPGLKWDDRYAWLMKLGGLVLTVIAVQMGSNFWFDALKKLVNMRSAGPPPAASANTQGGSSGST